MDVKLNYDKKLLDSLREIAGKSTRVVSWYAYHKEVRGPHNRWFTCSDVSGSNTQHVSSIKDDCMFAAAAMNNFVALLDLVDEQQRKIEELMIEKILLEE